MFDVLAAVKMPVVVLRLVTAYGLLRGYQRYG
jgi:hypothetical protein